jgi:hypothetical protein
MRMIHVLAALVLIAPQGTETAAASKATASPLPAGASRLLEKAAMKQLSTLLKSVYKDFPLEGIEALFWTGDYSGGKGEALRRETGKLLTKDGYEWKEAADDLQLQGREVFVCSAIRKELRVYGLWVLSNEGALLAWGRSGAPVPAGSEFGNVIYAVPKGWKADVAADSVTLTPTDLLPEEKLFVLLLSGREFKGDLKESAQELWTEACEAFKVDGGKLRQAMDVTQSLKGWSYFRYSSEVRPATGRLFLNVTFIKVGDRLERAAVLTNYVSAPYQETPFDSPKYHDVINRFVFSLKFKNHAEPKLEEGSLRGEGIVGVWTGLKMDLTARTGNLDFKAATAAFFSNGQVFYSAQLQTFLFEGASPILAREITPRWWGTWTFDQGAGTIKMITGNIAMELQGENLVLTTNKTPHKFFRLAPVDGARLEGTWAFAENNGKIPKITFTADGRFKDEGALNVLEHSLYRLYATTGKPGEGSYEVKNYTILFHYADGREFTSAFLGLGNPKGDRTPAALTLGFNHDTLKRL